MNQGCHATADDSLSTQYSHGLNTDTWTARLNFQSQFDTNKSIWIMENANTSRLKVTPENNKWKDQHTLNATLSYRYRPNIKFSVIGNHHLFLDRQSGFQNDIRTQMLALGAAYQYKYVYFPATLGIKNDKRFGKSDTGLSYSMSFQIPQFQFHDYTHLFQGSIEGDDLNRRKNDMQGFSYQVLRQFYQNTADTLRLQYMGFRRDYYISFEGDIESREENTKRAENRLTYQLGPRAQMHFTGQVAMHQLKISLLSGESPGLKRERKDFLLFGAVRIHWQQDWMTGDFQISHQSEDQQYQLAESLPTSPYSGSRLLRTPDNQGNLTVYIFKSDFPLGLTDSLEFNTHFEKFQYDTPDEANYDDRDELRWHIDLSYRHWFTPALLLQTRLNTHLTHLVYIFGEKSADNNWTRILKLEPALTWRPCSDIRLKQSASILSNYVDYDFESELTGIRSFLYRKFQAEDSVWINLSPKTQALLQYRLELDENGKLIWDQWLEQKLADRQSHTLTLMIDYSPCDELHMQPGYSYYIRTGSQYLLQPDGHQERKNNLNFKSHGPVLKWFYNGQKIHLNFSAQSIRTKTLNMKHQVYTRLDFTMNWFF